MSHIETPSDMNDLALSEQAKPLLRASNATSATT